MPIRTRCRIYGRGERDGFLVDFDKVCNELRYFFTTDKIVSVFRVDVLFETVRDEVSQLIVSFFFLHLFDDCVF